MRRVASKKPNRKKPLPKGATADNVVTEEELRTHLETIIEKTGNGSIADGKRLCIRRKAPPGSKPSEGDLIGLLPASTRLISPHATHPNDFSEKNLETERFTNNVLVDALTAIKAFKGSRGTMFYLVSKQKLEEQEYEKLGFLTRGELGLPALEDSQDDTKLQIKIKIMAPDVSKHFIAAVKAIKKGPDLSGSSKAEEKNQGALSKTNLDYVSKNTTRHWVIFSGENPGLLLSGTQKVEEILQKIPHEKKKRSHIQGYQAWKDAVSPLGFTRNVTHTSKTEDGEEREVETEKFDYFPAAWLEANGLHKILKAPKPEVVEKPASKAKKRPAVKTGGARKPGPGQQIHLGPASLYDKSYKYE